MEFKVDSASQVGTWGECDLACDGGIQNRTVECINQYGSAVNASLCPGKVPADELQCNVLPCNFCSQTTCAGQASGLIILLRGRLEYIVSM